MSRDHEVGPAPTFVRLLRQLEDAHNREIGRLHDAHDSEVEKLRLEVSRLRHVSAEIGSNGTTKTPEFDEPPHELAGIPLEKPREMSPKLYRGAHEEDIPDEGGHTAPLIVAKDVNRGFKPLAQEEEGYSNEEEEEKPDSDVLEAALRVAAYEEESTEVQGFLSEPQYKPPSELHKSSYLHHDRSLACTEKSSASNKNLPAALHWWGKLINAVKAQRAAAAHPRLNKVWKQERSPAASFVLQRAGTARQLEMLVSRATVMKSQRDVDVSISGELLEKVSRTDSCFSRTWKTSMLHPTSRKRALWDVCAIALLVHDLIVIPLHVFDTGTDGMAEGYNDFLDILDFVGASFWTLDILVSFRTGIYSEQGFVEMRPWPVAQNYIKSWLPLDLFIVCTDWCTMFLGMSSAAGFMRIGKTVSRFMRVLRLLRFLKMNQALIQFLARIHSEYVLQVMGLMKTLVLIIIINHYIACGWYGLGRLGYISSWPDVFLVNYPESFTYAYTTSLHWSLTQFTPASMEVVPENSLERIFVIAVIIVALVAFSSFVSSITTTMTYIRQMNAEKVELEAKIRQFFAEHDISKAMASRVWHYFRYNRIQKAKRLKESDIPAFEILPERIKEDMRLEVYLPTLRVHPLFAEYGKREQFAMRKICNEALSELSLAVGEELWRGVEEVHEMLFIVLGSMVYHEEVGSLDPANITEDYAEIHVGQWACELCLWAERAMLPGVFMALTQGCEIILLDAAKFQTTASSFTGSLNFLVEYASLFMNGFNSAASAAYSNEDTSPADAIFNKIELAEEMVHLAQGTRQSAVARITSLARNIIATPSMSSEKNSSVRSSAGFSMSFQISRNRSDASRT